MIKGLCGGKRFITYEDLNLVTVDNIKEKAIQLFFPDGISYKGNQKDFNFKIQDQNGRILIEFKDNNDKICDFNEYLTTNRLYASKVKFNLLSSHKNFENIVQESDSEPEKEPVIEKSSFDEQLVEIHFRKFFLLNDIKNLNFYSSFAVILSINKNMYQICESEEGQKIRFNSDYYCDISKGNWNGTHVLIRKTYVLSSATSKSSMEEELTKNYRIRHPNIVLLLAFNIFENNVSFLYEYFDAYNLEYLMFNDIGIVKRC